MASCGRALFSFLLCFVLFSSLLCPVFSAADDIEVTPQTYWMAPGELWVGFFSPVSRDEPYTAEVSHFSGVHSGTGQIVRLTIPAYGEGFSSSALNAPSEHSAVSNLPVSFIFSFSCSGLSATDWYISADPSSQVRKLSDNSFLVENYHGESLALSSLSADVSSSVSVSMAYRPYDSELQADLNQIVSLLTQQVSIQTSGFFDVQYALDRDGFTNLTITDFWFNRVPSSLSYDSALRMYKVVSDSNSGNAFRLFLRDLPARTSSSGYDFYITMLASTVSDYNLRSYNPFSLLFSPSPTSDVEDIFVSDISLVSSYSVVHSPYKMYLYKFSILPSSKYPFYPSSLQMTIAFDKSYSHVGSLWFSVWSTPTGGDVSDVTAALNRIQAETDSNMQQSINQGQAAATDQLQSEIDKSEAFESQIFEDVNNYTKQLDFGLSDWSEAASGISYISSIFMMIWNNSPKQPIVLSLMFGLCMLLLGRGARLAGEIRRASERSERRTKGS